MDNLLLKEGDENLIHAEYPPTEQQVQEELARLIEYLYYQGSIKAVFLANIEETETPIKHLFFPDYIHPTGLIKELEIPVYGAENLELKKGM